jgi:signal transduction histidine kinase
LESLLSIFSTRFLSTAEFMKPPRDAMSDTMTAGFAHELNNLLTVMQGSLEQLHRHQNLDERGQKQLERAEWAVRQASHLTQQILSFAQPETRQDQISDINSLVTEFSRMADQMVPEGISLVLDLAPQPLPVRLDPGQLELALLNLLRNAVQAIPGSGQIVIRTSSEWIDGPDQPCMAEVSVSDTGTGMSPEIAQSATAPFVTTKAASEGTGLGLWMVQRFVTAAAGRLKINTTEGQGTTIRLIFPRFSEV